MDRRELVNRYADAMSAKYAAGQREHGGDLNNKPVLGHAIDEALDLGAYLLTHFQQQKEAKALLTEAIFFLGTGPDNPAEGSRWKSEMYLRLAGALAALTQGGPNSEEKDTSFFGTWDKQN